MGRIVEYHEHSYQGKNFNGHLLSIQKRLAKVITRESLYLTVVFVGETHHTIDERRRAALYGWRPASPALLTVVERGMGTPGFGTNLVVEPMSSLASLDPKRDDNVVGQIVAALAQRSYNGLFILFGEDHEHKFKARMETNPGIPAMIWHFYPSFHDHLEATSQTYPPYDPRGAGFVLIGMVRPNEHYKMDLMQLAEGVMPKTTQMTIKVMSPFKDAKTESNFALFARPPVLAGIQGNLRATSDASVQVSWDNLKNIKILDIANKARKVPPALEDDDQRIELIESFWSDWAS